MTFWKELYIGLRRPMLAVGCVFLAFILSVGALTALLGTWPPFMVVESRSMQHDDNSSAIGIIDTGDVVVVSDHQTDGVLRTYLDSLQDGYQSFGEYGDVAIYQPPGEDIPIVHRALCEVVYNSTAGGFDIPDLANVPASMWSVPDGNRSWRGLTEWVELHDVGYAKITVHIDLNDTYRGMGSDPHGGLITMGDNNWKEVGGERFGVVDQGNLIEEPIRWEWVIGKVVGEVPWLGTIRLWLTGTAPPYLPVNTIVLLMTSVTSLALLPVALWASAVAVERHRRRIG
jgi:signal peptidase